MLFVVETYIRHPFSENDINTILFWHEDLHFSAELIVYLVEYCVSKGHTNLRYLNKVALAWHEKKITSVKQPHTGRDFLFLPLSSIFQYIYHFR